MINTLIADDHPIVLDGLKALLDTEPLIHIVGEAYDGKGVLNILRREKVDVALIDITMPTMNGVEVVKQMTKEYPETGIIMLTMHDKKEYILKLMNMGVSGYILKSNSEEVVEAIKKVYNGGKHFGPDVLATATQAMGASNALGEDLLTNREKEILALIGECKSTKQIADELFIASTTVETHIRHILAKLDLDTRMHLVRYAVEHGFTS